MPLSLCWLAPACRWTTWIQYIVYSLGNVGFFAQQGVILYFWMAAYNALRKRGADPDDKPDRLYWRVIFGYAVIEASLVVLYFFVPFFTVICIHSVFQALVSTLLAGVFVYLFCHLRAALEPSEMLSLMPRRERRGSEAGNSSLLGTTTLSSSASYGTGTVGTGPGRRGMYSPLENDPAELERRRKMSKITFIAGVCTVANLFRGCIMAYQSVLFFEGEVAVPDSWWLVILLDYGFAEVFAFAAVLFILRKPTKPPTPKPLAAVSADVAYAASPAVSTGMGRGNSAGFHSGGPQVVADRRLGLGRASASRQASGLSLAPTPAPVGSADGGLVGSGSVRLLDGSAGNGMSAMEALHRGPGAKGLTNSARFATGGLLSLPASYDTSEPYGEGSGHPYGGSHGQSVESALLARSTDAVVGLHPRGGDGGHASSSLGIGTGSGAVSRSVAADNMSQGGDTAGFADEYDDAASYRGSEVEVSVPLSGSASMWDTPLRVSAAQGDADGVGIGGIARAHGGMGVSEDEEDEGVAEDPEDSDWAGADYSLVLATPTASGAILSPSSSAGGMAAGGSAGGASGGYHGPASDDDDLGMDGASEPIAMPGVMSGSFASRGVGGLIGTLAAQLEPVKESVESDTAFPDSVSKSLR